MPNFELVAVRVFGGGVCQIWRHLKGGKGIGSCLVCPKDYFQQKSEFNGLSGSPLNIILD